jgi:hypothetical protein
MGETSSPEELELFNLCHLSLRNVIERIFSILKRQFKCLATALEYVFDIQVKLIFALTALHNFIRFYNNQPDIFKEFNSNNEKDDIDIPLDNKNTVYIKTEIDELRELIATNM